MKRTRIQRKTALKRTPFKPTPGACSCGGSIPMDGDQVCKCGSSDRQWGTETGFSSILPARQARSGIRGTRNAEKPLRAGSLRRSPIAQRGSGKGAATGLPKTVDFPLAERRKIAARSKGICEFRGCTARATDRHHRQRRDCGDHTAVNCFHGCREHHRWAHANPVEAEVLGLIVWTTDDPATRPVLTDCGWVLLTAEGGYEPVERGEVA